MKHILLTLVSAIIATTLQANDKPQLKVDISMFNRSEQEVNEPGYAFWPFNKDVKSLSATFDGITFTISLPTDATNQLLRSNWSKTLIQNAANKEKNGRLLNDAVVIDPDQFGEFNLTIEGLPAGKHTIQTYHNRWTDPAKYVGWPINVKLNGELRHTAVPVSMMEQVAANAAIIVTEFEVSNDGEPVTLSFYTAEGDVTDFGGKTSFDRTPLLNGFELNTVSITAQAKDPYPTNGNMHTDCDDGTCTLSWSPANSHIMQHRLFFGTDSVTVSQMTTPTATLSANDTTFTVSDMYTLNTYWWRIDEVDAEGNITVGQVWSFKPRHLAFPGAEGHGRFANGGRGGTVYHVTNLKHDHSPGSFLYGLVDVEGPRTIVFDISGIIEMDFGSVFADPNVTIAAQTAPGKGICLKYSNLNIGSDNICRFLRARRGYGDTGNAMGCTGADHAIIDHTTAAWGTDETFSSRGAKNITFQYSMIAEALGIADHKNYPAGTNHGYAATIDGKIGSFSHNLLVNCNGRNWSMGGGMDGENRAIGQMDIFNNVCYNWYGRTTDGNCHELNFVNNYYKMGPDTKRKELLILQYENVGHPSSTWQAYVNGNIRENKDHTITNDARGVTYTIQLSNGDPGPSYEPFVDKPFFPSYATIHSAKDAFKIVTSQSGATMPCRDDLHQRVTRETIEGTYTFVGSRSGIKGEIDNEKDCGGFEEFPVESRPDDWDTDKDGMPDWYETITGSNPDEPDNNEDPDHDGYTLLEDYLDFMAHPYIIVDHGAKSATMDMAQEFRGFTKSPTYTVSTVSPLFTATIEGSRLMVRPSASYGIGIVNVTCTDAEGTSLQQRVSIAVKGDPTGINSIYNSHPNTHDSYNLAGQKVGDDYKGIIIKNGQKIVVK